MGQRKLRYTFSGHETFQCKALWLKKGYDFVKAGNDFNSSEAVITLGVGKNMVSAIRYWMKAFGLLVDEQLTEIAHYFFDEKLGKDPYSEDIISLWMLHYFIVNTNHASIYKILFDDFHRDRKDFSTEQIQRFVKSRYMDYDAVDLYNENTVKKDIEVLLKNYVTPLKLETNEDYSVLLLEISLIRYDKENKVYIFNESGKRSLIPEVFLYAIIDKKGEDKSISYDVLLDISRIFCMNTEELQNCIKVLVESFKGDIVFSDNAGIKQIQFLNEINQIDVLNRYFSKR
jgi:hypothetical protein